MRAPWLAIIAGCIATDPIIQKTATSDTTRFVFWAGLEGSGHHGVKTIGERCAKTELCDVPRDAWAALVDLHRVNSDPGSLSRNGSIYVLGYQAADRVAAARRGFAARLGALAESKTSTLVFLNGVKLPGMGMLSYPSGGAARKSLTRPDARTLAAVAEAARADLRVVVLRRSAAAIVRSTVNHRRFGAHDGNGHARQLATLAENAAALAAQLSLVDASFFRCVDYDNLGDARAWGATAAWLHPGLGGGGLADLLADVRPAAAAPAAERDVHFDHFNATLAVLDGHCGAPVPRLVKRATSPTTRFLFLAALDGSPVAGRFDETLEFDDAATALGDRTDADVARARARLVADLRARRGAGGFVGLAAVRAADEAPPQWMRLTGAAGRPDVAALAALAEDAGADLRVLVVDAAAPAARRLRAARGGRAAAARASDDVARRHPAAQAAAVRAQGAAVVASQLARLDAAFVRCAAADAATAAWVHPDLGAAGLAALLRRAGAAAPGAPRDAAGDVHAAHAAAYVGVARRAARCPPN